MTTLLFLKQMIPSAIFITSNNIQDDKHVIANAYPEKYTPSLGKKYYVLYLCKQLRSGFLPTEGHGADSCDILRTIGLRDSAIRIAACSLQPDT